MHSKTGADPFWRGLQNRSSAFSRGGIFDQMKAETKTQESKIMKASSNRLAGAYLPAAVEAVAGSIGTATRAGVGLENVNSGT
jgi:hypothetical protein